MNEYRKNIGLNDKYKFGIEIEFSDVSLAKIYQSLRLENLPIKFRLNHKCCKTDFNNYWYLDTDSTVTKYEKDKNGKVYIGGELSSKILSDNDVSWTEIKRICSLLKENNASINKNCSCHINIDATQFVNNRTFYEVFSKLLALYEDDIILFYMGDKYLKRDTQNDFARPIKYSLLDKVNKIDFDNNDIFFNELLYKKYATFMLCDGINMQEIKSKKRLEVRYPNGTLDEKTIQNNINFTLKLIDAILNEKFDKKLLTDLVDKEIKDRWHFTNTSDYNYESFYKLIKTISTSYQDTIDMMNQYEKVLKTK